MQCIKLITSIIKVGDRLIIEPLPRRSLLGLLAGWEPMEMEEDFPIVEDLPVELVEL